MTFNPPFLASNNNASAGEGGREGGMADGQPLFLPSGGGGGGGGGEGVASVSRMFSFPPWPKKIWECVHKQSEGPEADGKG